MVCKTDFFSYTVLLKLCRGGSVTNLVKSLRNRGKYLDEDLIAYILYETLKVNFSVLMTPALAIILMKKKDRKCLLF